MLSDPGNKKPLLVIFAVGKKVRAGEISDFRHFGALFCPHLWPKTSSFPVFRPNPGGAVKNTKTKKTSFLGSLRPVSEKSEK